MDGLCEAAVCRPRRGARVSVALHASGSDLESPVGGTRRQRRDVSLEGLPVEGTDAAEDDDARARRVHAPISVARAAGWLSSHPPLRALGQCRPPREPGAHSESSGAVTAKRCDETARRVGAAGRRTADLCLPLLWVGDDRDRNLGAHSGDSRTARPERRFMMTPMIPTCVCLSAFGIAGPRANGLCQPFPSRDHSTLVWRRWRSFALCCRSSAAGHTESGRAAPSFNTSSRTRAGQIPIARRMS